MPTPLAQLTVCWHYTSRKGALKISTDGNEDNAKWVPGYQCSIHQVNRRVLIITLPEWFAVKIGLIAMGALPFGEKDDKFTDRKSFG